MDLNDLDRRSGEWLRGTGSSSAIVISSRVRLARNLAGYPFSTRAKEDERQEIATRLKKELSGLVLGPRQYWIDVDAADKLDTRFLVERHRISRELEAGRGPRGVFFVGCQSAKWFPDKFRAPGVEPLLFTTTNMAPEAYVGLALYDGIARGLPKPDVRRNVAEAYRVYQRLERAPLALFVNDWAQVERYAAELPVGECTPD